MSGMSRGIATPVFVMERHKLHANLTALTSLRIAPTLKILHALKSFHSHDGLVEILGQLDGVSIGNHNELCAIETIKTGYIHCYAPIFLPTQIDTLALRADSLSFNSLSQWRAFVQQASQNTSVGIRINPRLTLKQPKYCDPNRSQRLGISREDLYDSLLSDPQNARLLEGLHFHALCNQGLDGLKYLLAHIQKHYADLLPSLKWLNLGGGHSMSDSDYDRGGFRTLMTNFSATYPHLTLLFELGSSVIKGCGTLQVSIVDIIQTPQSDRKIAIVDTSIEAHLLDIAITHISPKIQNTSPTPTPYHYSIEGISCLAGDIIGEYFFGHELKIGDRLTIEDAIGYTIVKQTTFNGIENARFVVV